MERFMLEKQIAKTIIAPVDLNTADNTGLRVDMKNLRRCTFLVILAAGTTTAAHLLTLKQHTVASAGTPADLSVAHPYYHKVGAATSYTKVDVTTAAAAYDLHTLLRNSVAVVAFEVLAEDLTEGYRYVSLDIADAGGSQIGTVIALGESEFNPAYDQIV